MKKKNIIVSIDTGFDGAKIVVNNFVYHIPLVIQDITNEAETYQLRRIDNDYVRCIKDGHTYLIGAVARTYLLTDSRNQEKKSIMESFYTMERYNMPIFKVALSAFICYGLARYAEDSKASAEIETFDPSNIDKWNIKIGVALPHKYVEDLLPSIDDYLHTKQELEIMIGNDIYYSFSYDVEQTYFNSQTVALLINEVIDEDGNDVKGESVYDNLPALVLDGGYKTFGEFSFAQDQSITGDDSNLDYAMMNINHIVAEEIAKHTPGHNDYMIDEYCRTGEIIRYENEQHKVESIDVSAVKERVLKEVSQKMIKHLLDKYNGLLRTKMILVGGGTGQAYYPYLKEFCDAERDYLSDKLILAGQKPFHGKIYGPVFAVAIGLYKEILMQITLEEDDDE